MNKKFISLVLSAILMINCFAFTTVSAAPETVTLNVDSALTLINNMCDYLEGKDRLEVKNLFMLFHSYVSTDTGIDTLIGFVNDESASGNTLFDEYIDGAFGTTAEDKQKATTLLKFIKCIPVATRTAAFGALDAREAYNSSLLSAEEIASLERVYDAFLDENLQNMLATDHGLTRDVIFNFLIKLGSLIEVTDSSSDANDFAIYYINSVFSRRLEAEFGGDTINGQVCTTANDILGAIIATVNSSATFTDSLNADAKSLLGRDDINIYKSLAEINSPTPTPGGVGGGGGGGATVTPKPSTTPSATPTTTPTTTPSATPTEPTPTPVSPEDLEPIPAPPAAEGASYVDIDGHWSQDYIEALADRGIYSGYDDGTVRPDVGVTREEMAVLLTRILGIAGQKPENVPENYTDHNSIQLYARDAVYLLSELGIYLGYADGSFQPQNVLTREEIMSLFSRIIDPIIAGEMDFVDEGNISGWAYEAIEAMCAYGIVQGYPDDTIRPGSNVTRGEAAVMIYKLMFRMGSF